MIGSNPNEPTFLFDDLPLHWQMTRCEKYAFAALVEAARPAVAIEIGTYKGGSLQVLATHAAKVYSLDRSDQYRAVLGSCFENVEFLTGDSRQLLPSVLEAITRREEPLGFVLIDGDHTTEGVRTDINAVLAYVPVRPLYVVFHDSFNPNCRKGILATAWHLCPYVHYVEVDFIPGVYHYEAWDTARPRSMHGGLCVALMLPDQRKQQLVVYQSQKGLFDTVFRHSVHKRSLVSRLLSRTRLEAARLMSGTTRLLPTR